MAEINDLIATMKRLLKAKGLTYRDVAKALKLSEPSIKRMFASQSMSLDRLAQLCELLELSLTELVLEAQSEKQKIKILSWDMEELLVSDVKLLIVTVCILNHWTPSAITKTYQITEAECIQKLVTLDKLQVIELLPGNRVRLMIERDFDWIPNGPISQLFKSQGQDNYLNSAFDSLDESFTFLHGMFTESAFERLRPEIARLRKAFSELHEESNFAHVPSRESASMLIATRRGWEPKIFSELRRI